MVVVLESVVCVLSLMVVIAFLVLALLLLVFATFYILREFLDPLT